MANEARTVTDPLGNPVFLLGDLSQFTAKGGIYDDVTTVIRKPALVIETIDESKKEMHYFRSIGWDHTMLITAHFQNNRWEAITYQRDPPNEMLVQIIKKGKQLL
jgi:hypothetical protein